MKTYLGILLLAASLLGCDFPVTGGTPDPPPPPQTEVLEIRIDPQPIVAGDTVTFTAIIRDSLDTGFEFDWDLGIPSGSPFTGTRVHTGNENKVIWVVPDKIGLYNHTVRIYKSGSGTHAGKLFKTMVVEQP